MGYQTWICEYCKEHFGWYSVGGVRSWGKHKKKCENKENDPNHVAKANKEKTLLEIDCIKEI